MTTYGLTRKLTQREKAQEYVNKVNAMMDPQPCKYGHWSCAIVEGGMCSDELSQLFELHIDS